MGEEVTEIDRDTVCLCVCVCHSHFINTFIYKISWHPSHESYAPLQCVWSLSRLIRSWAHLSLFLSLERTLPIPAVSQNT